MSLFPRSGRFSRSFGQAWTTLDPNWRPGGPLAGPTERQNGGESHSWGQALTNLSTQSSAVDLHAQLNLRICYTWPSSWLRFLRFCANRMAWFWSGKETVKPRCSNCSDAFLAAQSWTGQLGTGTESVRMPSTGKPKTVPSNGEGWMVNGHASLVHIKLVKLAFWIWVCQAMAHCFCPCQHQSLLPVLWSRTQTS